MDAFGGAADRGSRWTGRFSTRCVRSAAVISFGLVPCLALAPATALRAQTLARPGWAGSGLTVERWWRHAVIVDVPAREGAGADSEWKGTIDRLDAMRSAGVDALMLRGLGADAATAATTGDDPGLATGDIEDLFHEASRHSMRVLVELRGDAPAADLRASARSWAVRGAAGFVVSAGGTEAVRTVRAAVRDVPGERVLVSAGAGSQGAGGAELQLESIAGLSPQPDPAQLRASLAALPAVGPALLLTGGDPPPAIQLARVAAAAVLLATPGAALLEEDWLGPATSAAPAAGTSGASALGEGHSTEDQLRQFSALHHGRPVFRDGTVTVLDHGNQGAVVWLRRGSGASGSVLVVAANLAAAPVRLSLVDDIAGLHLRGTFLKTISRSDNGLGAMPLTAVTLPGYGVYVGELSR